jgi:Zn finger protein HypA/HybF involved in hydrogenase expression
MKTAAETKHPTLEVADILREHGGQYRVTHPLTQEQSAVMTNIVNCRTAALGGHVGECADCGHIVNFYNSCRDRHCPKCQSLKKAEWLEQRLARLLPVGSFHVVFTIPDGLNPLVLRNKKVVYKILFRAASETLNEIAANPRHLGAQVGFTAVLHTWGQNLLFHPHLHCVVTAGGLSSEGRWINCKKYRRKKFLAPVKVLGKLFRGKFLAYLRAAYDDGELAFAGSTAELADSKNWRVFISDLYKLNWVVYAKPPFGGPEQVFRYLGRYTHRVAIANGRLLEMKNGRVSFSYKDYADGNRKKIMTLAAEEFIRRFLLHVLPKGFVRIRHFGLYASVNVHTRLEAARRLLEPERAEVEPETVAAKTWDERLFELTGVDVTVCPKCGGRMTRRMIEPEWEKQPRPAA